MFILRPFIGCAPIISERKISESSLDFAHKNETLETEINKKLKHTEDQLKNVEKQFENQIGYLNTSLRGHIVSIETDQKEKINGIEILEFFHFFVHK